MRRDFRPEDLDPKGPYHMMTSLIIPRPIAWVSTLSPTGVANLAPHSFFTVASADPPIVQFVSVGRKDTVDNVEATGEFVISFCSEPLFEQVNDTSIDYPAELSEFEQLDIPTAPSSQVAPPRVAASPASIECRLHSILPMGNCFNIFGSVVCFSVDEDVLDLPRPNRPHPRAADLKPLGRLGKNEWTTLGRILDEPRKTYRQITDDQGSD